MLAREKIGLSHLVFGRAMSAFFLPFCRLSRADNETASHSNVTCIISRAQDRAAIASANFWRQGYICRQGIESLVLEDEPKDVVDGPVATQRVRYSSRKIHDKNVIRR